MAAPGARTRLPGDPDVTIFTSGDVQVGRFRCPPSHPLFSDSGPTSTYCFVFPRTHVRIEHSGHAPFVADPNVATLYNPRTEYRREKLAADGDRSDWFAVSAPVLRDAVAAYDPAAAQSERLFRHAFVRTSASVYLRQRRLYEAAWGGEDPLLIEEGVLSLLGELLDMLHRRSRPIETETPRARAAVEAARESIDRSFEHNRSLRAIAADAGVSVFHLCRLFGAATGLTLHQYRLQVRLRTALERLRASGDVLTVAIGLGFCSHSHFCRQFHRAFGVTPSAARALPLAVAFAQGVAPTLTPATKHTKT